MFLLACSDFCLASSLLHLSSNPCKFNTVAAFEALLSRRAKSLSLSFRFKDKSWPENLLASTLSPCNLTDSFGFNVMLQEVQINIGYEKRFQLDCATSTRKETIVHSKVFQIKRSSWFLQKKLKTSSKTHIEVWPTKIMQSVIFKNVFRGGK